MEDSAKRAGSSFIMKLKGTIVGWMISRTIDHLNNYLNDKLGQLQATEVKIAGDSLEITQGNIGRERRTEGYVPHDYIEVWYLAPSPKDGKPYIGVMLVDFDYDVKAGMEVSGTVVNKFGDGEWPKSSDLVQAWGYKVFDSSSGLDYLSCPLEYFDQAPARSEEEESWRDKVRRSIG